MFVYSDPDFWEGDEGVYQMLVFSSEAARVAFQNSYAHPAAVTTSSGHVRDTGIGAAFKLRAIKNSRGKWGFLIRCGETATLLDEVKVNADTKEAALYLCLMFFHAKISSGLGEKAKSMHHIANMSQRHVDEVAMLEGHYEEEAE